MNSVRLSSGRSVPQLGFGAGTTWWKRTPDAPYNAELEASVREALGAGFKHLDLADMYNTDVEVGAAIKGTPRSDLFLTSKLLRQLPDVQGTVTRILGDLGTDYLDMLLVHAPFLPEGVQLKQVWQDMEALVDEGKIRSIGLSNFRIDDIKELLTFARIKPVLNQVEYHPYLQQPELHAFCRQNDIVMAGYSGLMSLTHKKGGPVDAVVERIAASHGLSQAQVLIMWGLQQGVVVITTSGKRERLEEYLAAAAAAAGVPSAALSPLSQDDIDAISEAGAREPFRKFWRSDFGLPPLT